MAISSGEPVEYDLSDWPEDARVDLGWMLRGRDIPYDLDRAGTLVVPETRSSEVDAFLEYLSAGPADDDDSMGADWRVAAASATSAPIELTVDEFYDGDPARLDSDEVELGHDWRNADADRCEISWIKDTGELFVIRAPRWEPMWVEVLAVIPTQEEVERMLQGWEAAMLEPSGVEWVRARVLAHDEAPVAPDVAPVAPDRDPAESTEASGPADSTEPDESVEPDAPVEPGGDLFAQLNTKFDDEQAEWSREHRT